MLQQMGFYDSNMVLLTEYLWLLYYIYQFDSWLSWNGWRKVSSQILDLQINSVIYTTLISYTVIAGMLKVDLMCGR